MQWSKFGQQTSVEKSNAYYIDETTGLRLNQANRQLGRIRINNFGFRGPDVTLKPADNYIRIAYLGSSTTFDAYSPEGANWPHLVATKLAQSLKYCEVDFINGGKPGFGSRHMAKLFRHYMEPMDPDIVVVFASDLNQDLDELAERQGFNTDHSSYRSLLNPYSVLLQKVEKNYKIINLQRQADVRAGKLSLDVDDVGEQFRRRLEYLTSTTSGDGRVVALATLSRSLHRDMSMKEMKVAAASQLYYMPYIYLPDMLDLVDSHNRVIRETAAKHGAVLIGGEHEMRRSSQYYIDTVHFSPE